MKKLVLVSSVSAEYTISEVLGCQGPGARHRVIGTVDDYSHGPLQRFSEISEFAGLRQDFWHSSFDFEPIDWRPDIGFEIGELFKVIDVSGDIEIWTAYTVQDCLFTIVMLQLLLCHGIEISRVKLREFTFLQSKRSHSSLQAQEWPKATEDSELKDINLSLYQAAWEILSSQKPVFVDLFARSLPMGVPIKTPLRVFVSRFADCNDDLGSMDRALLGAGTMGRSNEYVRASSIVGPAMALGMHPCDCVGDHFFSHRLLQLIELQPTPWFQIQSREPHFLASKVKLTEAGIAVADAHGILPLKRPAD